MKWALYKRVSSDEQATNGTSLQTQEELMRHAVGKDEVYKVYEDGGWSGGNINRPAITQLLRDAKDKKFQGVMVAKTDRLSRNIRDIVNLVLGDFDKLGLVFKSATEPFDTSTALGRTIFTMLGSFAAFERSAITERSVAGRLKKVLNENHWIGGISPFGFAIKDAKLVIDPEESKIVKLIYDWYTKEGLSARRIAIRLNGMKVMTATQKKYQKFHNSGLWKTGVLTRILANPLYYGEFAYKGHTIHYPAIIDKATFDLAKQQRKKNYNGSMRNTRKPALLRGLLKCGNCGENLYGMVKKPEKRQGWGIGYVYKAYSCLSKRPDPHHRSCGLPNLDMRKADEFIKDKLVNLFNNPDSLRKAIENKHNANMPDKVLLEVKVENIKKQIANT